MIWTAILFRNKSLYMESTNMRKQTLYNTLSILAVVFVLAGIIWWSNIDQWYYLIGMVMLICFLVVSIIVCVVILLVKVSDGTKKRPVVIALAVFAVLLGTSILHVASHSNYYKYNDWLILNMDIQTVEKIYGEFDLQTGNTVGYYMYKDNGPIMPSHLETYYYIKCDSEGKVQHVFTGCAPGG